MQQIESTALVAIDEMAGEAISNATSDFGITDGGGGIIESKEINSVENTVLNGVIHIKTIHSCRKAAGHRKPRQAITPENRATVANSLGIAWSVAKTSIDNASSPKYGVALRQAMTAQGVADFQRGDIVTIEVGIGNARYCLSGRASRKSTAYYWIRDFAEAGGIGLHAAFCMVIISVHSADGTTVFEGGVR